MSLLNPVFLLALLGIALPIWLHRRQSQTTQSEKFSSTMFLQAAKNQFHVTYKLSYLLLMFLRILFLLCLVLAFTRPTILSTSPTPISPDSIHHVIIIDSSFSMQEGDTYAQALAATKALIHNLKEVDQASIYRASSTITTIANPSYDQEYLLASLNSLTTDNGRLDMGAMMSSLDVLISSSPANIALHIVSDFQLSGQAIRFADMILDDIEGRSISLIFEQVSHTNVINLSVDSLLVANQSSVNVGIRGDLSSTSNKSLTLLINDVVQQQIPLSTTDASSQLSYFSFNDVSFSDGDNTVTALITPVDSLPEDDRRYAVFDNSPPAPVLLLSSATASLAQAYITASLETSARGYDVQITIADQLDTRTLQRYPWIIVEDLGVLPENIASDLHRYIENGGAVFAALGEHSLGLDTIPVTQHSLTNNALLPLVRSRAVNLIATKHPLLEHTVGWNAIKVMQSLPLLTTTEDKILVSLEDETPLLIERTIGKGRLVLFNSSLNNTWTDLPLKPIFVTFMSDVATYLSNESQLNKNKIIDDYLALAQNQGASGQVFDPDGQSLLSLAGTTQSQNVLLSKTGYYQLSTPQGEVLVAVNADNRESILTITDAKSLQNWQLKVTTKHVDKGSLPIDRAPPPTTKVIELWHFLLLLLLILGLIEALLSNRYLRDNSGA